MRRGLARHLVGELADLPEESLRKVEVEGRSICLARAEDGNVYALDDICTHEHFSLSEGEVWGMDVECPEHGSRFNLPTGMPSGPPAVVPERTYPVSIENGSIYLDV